MNDEKNIFIKVAVSACGHLHSNCDMYTSYFC